MSTAAQEAKAKKYQRLYEKGVLKKTTRKFNRCSECGRARGYIRFFGLCRICVREKAHKGLLPGVTKSSW